MYQKDLKKSRKNTEKGKEGKGVKEKREVTFTGLETGVIAGATTLTNFALVGVAWEAGVGVGSIISAAILPCEEEIEPSKVKGCK